ncbi:MAG TPA: alpha/beta fold hydrolase [Candidatus Limnocylindria bacterium]|nr:alpha/beta fold hydrolase [Candidatus Limnocylindria bacterium]
MARRTDPESVIRAQVVLEEHDLSPDGRFAVVVRRFVNGNRYRSHLWLVPLAGGGRPVQLTSGGVRDSSPRIAPDGAAVAFRRTLVVGRLRDARERSSGLDPDVARLRAIPLQAGGRPGKAWAIRTPRDRSVGELAWSPDGRRLALTLDAGPPRFIVGPEPPAGEEPLARRIDRIDWRLDETGHVDRWQHVHVVEARAGARPRQLTAGDWGGSDIAWSPDGSEIAFAADRHSDADVDPRTSIWAVRAIEAEPRTSDPTWGEPRQVFRLGSAVRRPAWSPDGRWLAAVGYFEPAAIDDESPGLVVGPADGSGPAWQVAPELDRPIGNWVDTDLHGWTASPRVTPCWLDAGTIVALVSDRGRVAPWRFDIDPTTGHPSGRPVPLAGGNLAAHSLAVATDPAAPREGRISFLATNGSRAMELMTVPAGTPAGPRPTEPEPAPAGPAIHGTLGSRWAGRFAWPVMDELDVRGPGGPIHTWLASPADARDAPLPTIVDIHGGPLGAWAPAPSIEVVLLCARGYRVILPNVRGSTSYGRDWIRPQLGDWGGVDAADVLAAVDDAVARRLADPDRLGVLGLSYGGFLVNWLLATTGRFRAGVSEAGVANQVSAWAGSDSGVEYNRMALLGAPTDTEGVAGLWRQSPLAHVANIRAPLLLLQGEADQRCPPSDAEQLFVALRVLGRTVEYVLYPEESHVYQAAGRPDRRIDRMNRVLDWFDRHVLEGGS